MANQLQVLDFNDTFLDLDHLKESFPGYQINLKTLSPDGMLERPFRYIFFVLSYLLYLLDSKLL